jgi:hypothetical protein
MTAVIVNNGLKKAKTGPDGSRRLRLPEFLNNRHMKVVRSSAPRTGRLYPSEDILGTHFSLKYNQQYATFSRSIYFYKLLYRFQAVPKPIIRSTKNVHTAKGIVKPILLPAAIVDEMELCSISVFLYLTLCVQFCAPEDGRRKRLKHVQQFIEIDRENVASCWLYFRDILVIHGHVNFKKRTHFC